MTLPIIDHPAPALARQVDLRSGAEALCFPASGGRMSFAQWQRAAQRLASGLRQLGVAPGDRVALLAENRIEWPVVQMACAIGGYVLAPLNTHYRSDDLAFVLTASRAKVLALSEHFRSNAYLDTVRALRPRLPDLAHVICLDGARNGALGYAELIAGSQPLETDPAADPDVSTKVPAALLYTSGTTGFPKGALLTHRGMMMCARETCERLGVSAGDRWTSIIPLFHCAGCILNILGSLQVGGTYVGLPAFDPEVLFQVIERERCTVLSGVPTSYLAMLNSPLRTRHDLSSLRTGTCGGADANPEVLERCARDLPMPGLAQVYGQTESSTLVTASAHDDPDRWATAGPPLPGHEMRIVDPQTGAVVADGSIGEVQARGPMVMLGYDGNAEATAETITPEGWLRTGDLGYVNPRGRLVIAGGRLRDMIIRGGENIYPVEIENLLLLHPAIAEVAVFGEPDEYYGETVAAAVKLRGEASADNLREHLQDRIARFKLPRRFYRVESFPLTTSGKIRKVDLRALAAARKLAELG